ncbi:primosomal protein N' [Saccharospirillum impatiens]|uniref:primosomal protein N' n=1 Tax=Saccharospirillum impatiens TaxID=169438 RepID=UPI0004037E3C|nr:primosomal protein N' [Saccharospirillum impatiens]
MTTTSEYLPSIADIAVPGPFKGPLSYRIEPGQTPEPGCRCLVPLRSRQVVGVVTSVRPASTDDGDNLKSILRVLDASPLLSTDVQQLAQWVSRYYLYDVHPAYMLALPAALRSGDTAQLNDEPVLELTVAGRHLDSDKLKGRRQREALALLQTLDKDNQPSTPALLRARGMERTHWKGLIDKRLLKQRPAHLVPGVPKGQLRQEALVLNKDQAAALKKLPVTDFAVQLLEGVTGSGKTEVYLQAMQRTLARGKRVLVLVPEIGLTPQTLTRFQQRFQDSLVALHSGLTDKQRTNAWLRAQAGEASIILGTRSAVLTPIPDLGLIVVDEEHDASYKQQDTLRYHARDLAIYRARLLNIPVMLGSATPSLESLHNAQQGRYQHQQLQQRAQGQKRARLETIDMRKQKQEHGVSERLLHRVRQHLEGGNQVLLFLNRRGYAPSWFCRQCGWMSDCPFCDARLTYHRGRHQMLCHHCGHQEQPHQQCPDCGSTDLTPLGAGTERAEEALASWFPDTPIIRFDRDSVANARDLEQQLSRAQAKGPAILVGTQMLAKGHHFERVTLVGIIDMDAGLFSADFRARERMGQLLVQVSGRSGRGDLAGEVVLQTFHPDHPFFTPLLEQDYPAFATQLLAERQRSGLPPFGFLACLRSDSAYPQRAEQLLKEMAQRLLAEPGIRVFGPLPALLSRRAGKHRFTLLVQSHQRSRLHSALQPLVADYPRQQRHLTWHLDIDPIDLM